MEEIVRLFFQMWVEFWETSTGIEKLVSIVNLFGATYTFILGLILTNKVTDFDIKTPDLNCIVARIALYMITLGSFLSIIVVRVPSFIEMVLLSGLTVGMTFMVILTNTELRKFLKIKRRK